MRSIKAAYTMENQHVAGRRDAYHITSGVSGGSLRGNTSLELRARPHAMGIEDERSPFQTKSSANRGRAPDAK
jgi:hypothetical protein